LVGAIVPRGIDAAALAGIIAAVCPTSCCRKSANMGQRRVWRPAGLAAAEQQLVLEAGKGYFAAAAEAAAAHGNDLAAIAGACVRRLAKRAQLCICRCVRH